MRAGSRTPMTLSLFVSCAVLLLGLWMPEAQALRVPLWLDVAALTAVLLVRRLDRRL